VGAAIVVGVDESGTGIQVQSSVGLTLAFLAVVAAVLVAVIVIWLRRRRLRREVERVNNKP